MKVIIQTPGFKAQQKLLDFSIETVKKLESVSDQITEVKLSLRIEKSDTRENKIVELQAMVPGKDIFAMRKSSSFEDAVLESYRAARHQLEKRKTVQLNAHRQP